MKEGMKVEYNKLPLDIEYLKQIQDSQVEIFNWTLNLGSRFERKGSNKNIDYEVSSILMPRKEPIEYTNAVLCT